MNGMINKNKIAEMETYLIKDSNFLLEEDNFFNIMKKFR
jgi:hypothetical protein